MITFLRVSKHLVNRTFCHSGSQLRYTTKEQTFKKPEEKRVEIKPFIFLKRDAISYSILYIFNSQY